MDAWIGYWNDNRPTAKTLAKPKQLDGETVKLLDGESWIVPKLREYAETDSAKLVYHQKLPSLLDYADDGMLIIGDVVPEYREVWEKSLAIADALTGGDNEGTVSLADQLEFAGPLLGINYYVSMFELTMLGIIGGEEAKAIVRAALDFNSLEERIKNVLSRHSSGGTNTTTGSAA